MNERRASCPDCARSYRRAIDDAIAVVDSLDSQQGLSRPLLAAVRDRLRGLAATHARGSHRASA